MYKPKVMITIRLQETDFTVAELTKLASLIYSIPSEFDYRVISPESGINLTDKEKLNDAPIMTKNIYEILNNG